MILYGNTRGDCISINIDASEINDMAYHHDRIEVILSNGEVIVLWFR